MSHIRSQAHGTLISLPVSYPCVYIVSMHTHTHRQNDRFTLASRLRVARVINTCTCVPDGC